MQLNPLSADWVKVDSINDRPRQISARFLSEPPELQKSSTPMAHLPPQWVKEGVLRFGTCLQGGCKATKQKTGQFTHLHPPRSEIDLLPGSAGAALWRGSLLRACAARGSKLASGTCCAPSQKVWHIHQSERLKVQPNRRQRSPPLFQDPCLSFRPSLRRFNGLWPGPARCTGRSPGAWPTGLESIFGALSTNCRRRNTNNM